MYTLYMWHTRCYQVMQLLQTHYSFFKGHFGNEQEHRMDPNKEYHQEEYVPCFRGYFVDKHGDIGDKQGDIMVTTVKVGISRLAISNS